MMHHHTNLSQSTLHQLIRSGEIRLAGNLKLRIYGKLGCTSGKRMNQINRVFFIDEEEAKSAGYRPCGHCMREAYKEWKHGIV